jgi:nucleotide-binding universal stress UspA family protein
MFERLLVAIDDSASCPVTLSFASALSQRHGASVHVLHVNQFQVGGRGITELTETEASRLVEGAVRELNDEGVETSGSLARATCFNVAGVIVDVARAHDCDAIVLGSARRQRFWRVFGQGIRERTTALAAVPILTAPAPLRVPTGRRSRDHPPLVPDRQQPTWAGS